MNRRNLTPLKLLPVLAIVALALPAAASGQATRTWVSGVGDDVNPCSRTAPCKTFAGAISKTFEAGIINVMDSGGYGAVTINKALTIDGRGHHASILASGSPAGVIVNTTHQGRDGKVVLRNLSINGGRRESFPGVNGIRVLRAKSVKVVNTKIFNFGQSAIQFTPANANAKLFVRNAKIHDNGGAGVMVSTPVGGGGGARASVAESEIDENACGLVSATHGAPLGAAFATNCGTATNTSGVAGSTRINAIRNEITDNDHSALLAHGNQSTIFIGDNEISGNTDGLKTLDAGAIASWGDNDVSGNSTDGSPNSTILKR